MASDGCVAGGAELGVPVRGRGPGNNARLSLALTAGPRPPQNVFFFFAHAQCRAMTLNPHAREWRPLPGGLAVAVAAASARGEQGAASGGGGEATAPLSPAADGRPTTAATLAPSRPTHSAGGEAAVSSTRGTPTAPLAMRPGGGRGRGTTPARGAPPLLPMGPPPDRAAPLPAAPGEDLTFDDLFHASASDAEDGGGGGGYGGAPHTPTRSSVSE